MDKDYLTHRTIDSLRWAQRHLQAAQRSIQTARSFLMLNGNERKLLDRTKVDLVEPIEDIQCVIDAQSIRVKGSAHDQRHVDCKHYTGKGLCAYRDPKITYRYPNRACTLYRNGLCPCPDYNPKENAYDS